MFSISDTVLCGCACIQSKVYNSLLSVEMLLGIIFKVFFLIDKTLTMKATTTKH